MAVKNGVSQINYTLRYSASFKGLMVASLQFHILLFHDSMVLHTKVNPKAAKSMRVLYF